VSVVPPLGVRYLWPGPFQIGAYNLSISTVEEKEIWPRKTNIYIIYEVATVRLATAIVPAVH